MGETFGVNGSTEVSRPAPIILPWVTRRPWSCVMLTRHGEAAQKSHVKRPFLRLCPYGLDQGKGCKSAGHDQRRDCGRDQFFLATDKIHWRAIQDRREAVSQAIGRASHQRHVIAG